MNINEMSAEEARNQADADSEVSEINTQNVNNEESMQEFRGMTASAVSFLINISSFPSVLIETLQSVEPPSEKGRSCNSHCALRSYKQRTTFPAERSTHHDQEEN